MSNSLHVGLLDETLHPDAGVGGGGDAEAEHTADVHAEAVPAAAQVADQRAHQQRARNGELGMSGRRERHLEQRTVAVGFECVAHGLRRGDQSHHHRVRRLEGVRQGGLTLGVRREDGVGAGFARREGRGLQ